MSILESLRLKLKFDTRGRNSPAADSLQEERNCDKKLDESQSCFFTTKLSKKIFGNIPNYLHNFAHIFNTE